MRTVRSSLHALAKPTMINDVLFFGVILLIAVAVAFSVGELTGITQSIINNLA